MIFFVLILLFVVISSAEMSKPNEFNGEYISRDGTNAIKGIFVILILFSHAKGYFASALSGAFDEAYVGFIGHIGQMVIAMFLFYSGYGMMEQIKKRQFAYIKSVPQKRFPNLLLNYDIAVLMFAIMALCLGKTVTLQRFLLSLVAWEGIGNSSWYIFVTLALYIIVMLSFFPIKWMKNEKLYIINIIAMSALTVGFILLLRYVGRDRWWYNTAFLFVIGFWYSYLKAPIEKIMMKNDMLYYTGIAVLAVVYVYLYLNRGRGLFFYGCYGTCFVLCVTAITMKVKIKSSLLDWFGKHVFSVYILQRIPMIIFSELGLARSNKYVFVIVSIAVTMAMAEAFDVATGKLAQKIWKPKKINA